MTVDDIKKIVSDVFPKFGVKRAVLFGSRADGTNRDDSDVDIIVEFSVPVTLITLGQLQSCLEDTLHLSVDIIHGPMQSTDMIEIHKEIEIYAA